MDRLKDLKVPLIEDAIAIDIAERESEQVKNSNALHLYLKDIEEATENINKILQAVAKIHVCCGLIVEQNSEKKEAAEVELEKIIRSTNKIAANMKSRIESLQATCDRFKVAGRNQSQDYRLRNNLITTLTRKYVEVMRTYQGAQLKYSSQIKSTISRRLRILNPSLSQADVDNVMASGADVGDLLTESIMQGESEAVRNAAVVVKDKYQDVLAMEKSVAELTQMFRDFALIVDQQGGLLDQIEENVKLTSGFVDGGNVDLHETVNLAISLRYKQCCLVSIVVFVLGGIIAIIFLKAKGVI